jgi:hypothetical protein
MRSDRSSGSRRRLVASGLAAGALAGAALGASLLGHTAATDVDVVRPLVLHAAPAVVTAGVDVTLAATAVCEDPLQPACDLQRAAALVRPWGADGWTRVDGKVRAGTISFDVPGELIPPEGFSYWLDVVSDTGVEVAYPPAGASGAIRVVTSAGLPERSLPAFDWDDRAAPAHTVLRLMRGEGEGQVGFAGVGTEDGIRGPSSFDLTVDGEIVVADPINRRVQWFSAAGEFRRAEAIPTTHDVDLAVQPDGALALAGLGTSSTAYELSADGDVTGSYPIGFGVVSRVAAGEVPRVRVGEGQWVPIRGAEGAALSADAQGRAQTSSVPLADGRVGYAGELQDGRLAVAWTRPDGSRGGVVLRLPTGVQAGADYFVHPLPDGGALVARGLWDDSHFGVAVLRLDATGRLRAFRLLPEPSRIMAAPYSTVRSVSAHSLVMAEDDRGAIVLRRYAV